MAVRKDEVQISIAFLTDESREYAKLVNQNKQFIKDLNKAKRNGEDLTDVINKIAASGKQAANIDLSKLAPSQLTQRARQIAQAMRLIPQSAPQYQQLESELKQVNDQLKTMRERSRGVNLEMSKEPGRTGLFASLREFIRNPLAIVGGIAAIGAAAMEAGRQIGLIVEEVSAVRREIGQLTGATGQELDEITVRVRSIAQTFAENENELLRSANTLVKEFGITYGEAFDQVEQGFLRGANASGEFLDNVREYSTQFAAAGFSAQDFINLSIKAQQEGIFSDKGLDVVKEFGLRIREQTTAVRDAMIGAFGREFSEQIFQGINDGSITTQQALERVVTKMEETEIPANRLQTVIADVFAAPGEDAGINFLTTLNDTAEGFENVDGEARAYLEAQEELLRVNRDLAEAQNELTKNLEDSSNSLNTFWVQIKTTGLQALNALFAYADQTAVRFEAIGAATRQFFSNIVTGLKTMIVDAQIAIRNVQSLNPFGDTSAIAGEIEALRAERAELQKEAVSTGEAYSRAYIEGIKKRANKAEIAKALQPDQKILGTSGGTGTGTGATDKEIEELEKKRQRLLDIIKKYKTEEEIAELDAEDQKIAKLAAKYDQSIEEAKALEARGVKEATDIRLQLEEQKSAAISRLRTEQLHEMFMKEQEIQSQLEEEDILKRLEYQERKKEAEQQVANELLNLTLSDQQKALRELEQHKNQLLQVAQQYGLDTLDIEITYRREKERIQKEYDEKEKEQILKANQEKAQLLASTFGSLSSVFSASLSVAKGANQEYNEFTRALALSQIALSTAQGIAQAVASGSGVPFPGNLAAIATGISTVLAAIAQAKKVFADAPKLAGGGYTGPGQGPRDQTGHRPAGIVHEGEWVAPKWMVDQYGPTIANLENIRRRGYAEGGMVNTTPTSAPIQVNAESAAAIEEARMLRMEFTSFKKEISKWQRDLRARVVYTDIEDTGTTLNDIRVEASL